MKITMEQVRVIGRKADDHWKLIVAWVWIAIMMVVIELILPFPFLKPFLITVAVLAAVLGTVWSLFIVVRSINKWRDRHEVG